MQVEVDKERQLPPQFIFPSTYALAGTRFLYFLSSITEPPHFQQPRSFSIVRPLASTLHYRV